MKKNLSLLSLLAALLAGNVFAFDTVTVAKVVFIDEWDVSYTKIKIDKPTSCGRTDFWIQRNMDDYDRYLSRALAALVSGREIRIVERAPAYCQRSSLDRLALVSTTFAAG